MDFYRDTFIEINLDAVRHNIENLRHHFYHELEILAVVKADAYGHGAVMVAKELMSIGVNRFAVATIDEAIELRLNGIDEPILIFGSVAINHLDVVSKYHLSITANSIEWLKKALENPQAIPINVEIKIDSGMNRFGFSDQKEFLEAVSALTHDSHFCLEGIYSHLATSEEADDTYYQYQIQRFESLIKPIDKTGLLIHIGNSAGSIKTPPPFVNMVRVGLFLNGVCPGPNVLLPFQLEPSLSLYSKIVQIKKVPAHTKISYNGIYETTKETIIATVSIGYADGYDRRMQAGLVYVANHYAKVVGRICMDSIMVELEDLVPEGTIVELIGPHITIDQYCIWVNTNNYHATCAFTDRLPRVYKRGNKIIAITNRRLKFQI
ncbi:MAG: alanine racemase [Candidatus Izemoplasmatales bacterium]|jgi:alanine racemase|nr:alanine racemase [Candidatus Izemoplasmatales bacterium]